MRVGVEFISDYVRGVTDHTGGFSATNPVTVRAPPALPPRYDTQVIGGIIVENSLLQAQFCPRLRLDQFDAGYIDTTTETAGATTTAQ